MNGRSTVFAGYVAVALAYLGWRVTTINLEHPIWSLIFFAAEVFSVVNSIIFYGLIVKRAERPEPARAGRTPSVDVLIATYNEELELLRTTVVAARDMDGAHRTWICDDGRRPAVAALAHELGVGYITRPINEHFKAGNLNHALGMTRGELVLVLDADHVPRRQMLARMVPRFADPRVALVQAPQVFYNIDSFQHAISIRRRHLWHEAAVFHHMMQPGADRLNASFFIGTGALLRRSALDEVGGIATGSITEDIWTAMRLHARGYRSVYLDEALGYLLAPDTPFAYAQQRLRWAQGNMQILRRENPLRTRGLSLAQRLCYLVFLGGYLSSYQHLIFYLAPALYLLGNLSPIAADPHVAIPILVTRVVTDIGTYKILAAPYAHVFFSECFKLLNAAIYIRGSLALLTPRALPFKVTPKGKHGGLPLALVIPAAAIFALNLTALGLGVNRLLGGDPTAPAIVLCMLFAAQFALVGALALLHVFQRQDVDELFTFPVALDASLDPGTPVHVRRLSRTTAYVLAPSASVVGAHVRLDLGAAGIDRPLAATVRGAEPLEGRPRLGYILRLTLDDVTAPEGDALDRFVFNTALPRFFAGFRDSAPAPAPDDRAARRSRPRAESGVHGFFHVRSGIL